MTFIEQFDNGMTLLGEPLEWLESAAFSMLLPAGCSQDPRDKPGLSNFVGEMVQRGCGDRDSRQFVETLERLGVDRAASVTMAHTVFNGALLADKLHETLALYADLVRRPSLPADQLDEGRQVCFQEIRSLEDDLAQKSLIELRRLRYADPYGRSCQGTMESVEAITIEDIQNQFQTSYRPNNTILSVAGKFDWDQLREEVAKQFGDWAQVDPPAITEVLPTERYVHIPFDSRQTHIAIAFPNVAYGHPDYYRARGAVGVLSDGMSSRLFTEVREKRGLCYTVYASCHTVKGDGSVLCYAGTTTERAQETLEVLLHELKRLSEGIEEAELSRMKAKIKSLLIMQQESSMSRSGSVAADWYHLGKVQTLDYVGRIIDELNCDQINTYLAENPARDFRIVTLGEKELELPVGIS